MGGHTHKLGDPWTNDQLEQAIQGLFEREELDAADAIIWLRFELARKIYMGGDTVSRASTADARSGIRPLVD